MHARHNAGPVACDFDANDAVGVDVVIGVVGAVGTVRGTDTVDQCRFAVATAIDVEVIEMKAGRAQNGRQLYGIERRRCQFRCGLSR